MLKHYSTNNVLTQKICIQQDNNKNDLPSRRDEYQMAEFPNVFQTPPGSYSKQHKI